MRRSSGVLGGATLLGVSTLAAALALGAGPPAAETPTPLETILERAGAYVVRYAASFRNLVAEETYRQYGSLWGRDAANGLMATRTLRSELVFVTTPGSIPWGTFRDVLEVNGQKLRDRDARLERLFVHPSPDVFERARAILAESARYNVGTAFRNVNVPNLALLFLEPTNQPRLTFRRRGTGTRTIAGFAGVEVAFEERARPTIVRDPAHGEDVPARGRFWIDASRGTVLRAEIEYDLERNKLGKDADRWERAAIATEYRREPGLDIFVPASMTELYHLDGERIECTARYVRYRRFEVSTQEKARTADEPRPRD